MKQHHLRRRLAIVAAVVVILIVGGLAFAGNYLVDFAIVRKDAPAADVAPASVTSEDDARVIERNKEAISAERDAWLATAEREEVSVTSDDGLKLAGEVFWTDRASHRWVIAVHGYTDSRRGMQNIAGRYAARGFNVLTPDMRAHGESEGTYIGMGWPDRLDLLKWIDLVIERDANAEIILHGVSMGGATVMMTSGEDLPEQVKGIVEDCGYTSVWDIFSDELSYLFGLPEFPVLYAADLVAQVRAGYEFKEASAKDQVAKSRVPILFIHGSEDTFVHTDMVYELYDACASEKDLLVVEGAGHGEAYAMDPELYFGTVFSFIEGTCGVA